MSLCEIQEKSLEIWKSRWEDRVRDYLMIHSNLEHGTFQAMAGDVPENS